MKGGLALVFKVSLLKMGSKKLFYRNFDGLLIIGVEEGEFRKKPDILINLTDDLKIKVTFNVIVQ